MQMKSPLSFTLLIVSTLILANSSDAAIRKYVASITHDQEPGGIPNEGTSGTGVFFLNDDNPASPSLSYDVKLLGLDFTGAQTADPNDNITRTHFHGGAFGVNGGIIFGQIDGDPNLRNDLDDLMVDNIAGTIKGVWDNAEGNGGTLAQRIANGAFNLDSQNRTGIYFNVHTSDHAGGEIRGQLIFVPEPATLAMASLTAIALGGLTRRRR
jgi:CHRD domain